MNRGLIQTFGRRRSNDDCPQAVSGCKFDALLPLHFALCAGGFYVRKVWSIANNRLKTGWNCWRQTLQFLCRAACIMSNTSTSAYWWRAMRRWWLCPPTSG